MSFERALVVGASSGIGAELVRKLLARNCQVAGVARRAQPIKALGARAYVHDVRNYEEAPELFDRIVEDLGGLDLLIYNSGVMPPIEEHEYNFEKDREVLEVNLLGAVNWLNLGAAQMESQRSGTLVGISSVAGDRGRRGFPAYTTSKAGLTAFMEALRNRLHRYGVQVVTVKPGPVRTPMTDGMELPFIIDAAEAADGVLSLARRGTGEGYVPLVWWPIMSIIRSVPSFIFRKTNI